MPAPIRPSTTNSRRTRHHQQRIRRKRGGTRRSTIRAAPAICQQFLEKYSGACAVSVVEVRHRGAATPATLGMAHRRRGETAGQRAFERQGQPYAKRLPNTWRRSTSAASPRCSRTKRNLVNSIVERARVHEAVARSPKRSATSRRCAPFTAAIRDWPREGAPAEAARAAD